MEETFRLEVFDDLTTAIPRRLLALLGITEGGEIRIVANDGYVSSIRGIQRQDSAPVVPDDEVTKQRRQAMLEGKHDSMDELEASLNKPSVRTANRNN